jgi:hypothetical protein
MAEGCSLYRHFAADGTLLYVGILLSTLNRLGQHKQNAEWFDKIARVEIEQFPSRRAALEAERTPIQEEHPSCNVMHAQKKHVGRGRQQRAKRADSSLRAPPDVHLFSKKKPREC